MFNVYTEWFGFSLLPTLTEANKNKQSESGLHLVTGLGFALGQSCFPNFEIAFFFSLNSSQFLSRYRTPHMTRSRHSPPSLGRRELAFLERILHVFMIAPFLIHIMGCMWVLGMGHCSIVEEVFVLPRQCL